MNVFQEYSTYYDLLYQDKNYRQEAEYIAARIKKYLPEAGSLLDVGCGTGSHLAEFAKIFLRGGLCGIDISPEMIGIAKRNYPGLWFEVGDMAAASLGRRFDVVTSLFHVMSYQTDNGQLAKCFAAASKHLEPKGLFIFDCWYGPGVLTDKPVVRVKELENDQIKVFRIACPQMHPGRNVVDVNYSIIIVNKRDGQAKIIKEKHEMRYLFKPEVEYMLKDAGFRLIDCKEYLTDKEPDEHSWNVIFMAEKQ